MTNCQHPHNNSGELARARAPSSVCRELHAYTCHLMTCEFRHAGTIVVLAESRTADSSSVRGESSSVTNHCHSRDSPPNPCTDTPLTFPLRPQHPRIPARYHLGIARAPGCEMLPASGVVFTTFAGVLRQLTVLLQPSRHQTWAPVHRPTRKAPPPPLQPAKRPPPLQEPLLLLASGTLCKRLSCRLIPPRIMSSVGARLCIRPRRCRAGVLGAVSGNTTSLSKNACSLETCTSARAAAAAPCHAASAAAHFLAGSTYGTRSAARPVRAE